MQLIQPRGLLNEVLLQGVFLEGLIAMLEGALRCASMCKAYYRTFSYSQEVYRFGQQQFLNANFVWNQAKLALCKEILL